MANVILLYGSYSSSQNDSGTGVIAFIAIMALVVAACWFIASLRAGEAFLFDVPWANSFFRKLKYGGSARNRFSAELSDFNYFTALSEEGKKKFLDRLSGILMTKYFEGNEGLKVSEPMRVHVAACMTQITFGMDDFLLNGFEGFQLYPHQFRVGGWDAPAREGSITKDGSEIKLSMKSFMEGYSTSDDNKNIGLYEMSRALMNQLLVDEEGDNALSEKVYEFQSQSDVVFEKLKMQHVLFEDEAFDSKRDFFSACIVHFFETPEDFRKHIPIFYDTLCRLLNQDPMNKTADYALVSRANEAPPQGDAGIEG